MCGFGCLKQFDICNVCGTHHTLAILTDITPSIFKNACQYLLLYIQKAQPNQCIVHYTLSFCSASTFIIGRCICWVGKSGQCIPLLLYLSIFFPYEQTCPLENTYDNYDPQGNIIFFANSGLTRSLLFGGQSSYSYSISLKWEHNTYSLYISSCCLRPHDEFANTLRAYQKRYGEMKRDERDKAETFHEE